MFRFTKKMFFGLLCTCAKASVSFGGSFASDHCKLCPKNVENVYF